MVKFISTRDRNMKVSAHEAVIKGLADDGGLFSPETIDAVIDPVDLLDKSYQEIAAAVIGAVLDDYSEEEIRACVAGAYDRKFDTPEIAPVTKMADGWLTELYHGPTSAFKDVALTILPLLLTAAYRKDSRSDIVSILTATSGDTGKAALSGFADVPNTAITVFYPEVGVSAIQKRQMATCPGSNVEVIAVRGNFDDCQRMVKEAVSSPEVKAALKNVTISSANSINIGRLVPQIVYYYSSYLKLVERGDIAMGEAVNFSVPTGNFGDVLAGWFAKKLGLPVNRLIVSSNTNNVLTDFFNTGTYSVKRPFHTTMSPSMDILISSNLERLLFMASGNDDVLVRDLMGKLKNDGIYTIPDTLKETIGRDFSGVWCNEEECADVIYDVFNREGLLVDPHTAVGIAGMQKYRQESGDHTPCIVLSTASAYKFAHDVLKSLKEEDPEDDFAAMEHLHEVTGTAVPPNLASLKDMPIRFTRVIDREDGIHVIAKRMEELGK